MKFGVQATQANTAWPDYLSLWQELDRDTQFDYVWTVDHFVTGLGTAANSGNPHLEGWIALAAVAQATERVRIGCLVTGVTYRHPVVLAKMATTVDHISNGRLEFGIGAAWHEFEHRAYGIHFPPVKERMDRLEEALHIIKLLWTAKESVGYKGRYYQLEEAPYSPANVQEPHPPIMVGGSGEKRTLRIAAKYADAINVNGSPETIRHKVEVLRRHGEEVGRDTSGVRVTAQVLLWLTDDAAMAQRVVQGMAMYRGVSEEEARKGVLVGSVGEVKERVAAFAEAGVDEIHLLQTRPHRESLLRFSQEVIPAFR